MANCPWSTFTPASIAFCENRLCEWITEPANTWSNIGYLIVGGFVIYAAFRAKRTDLSAIGFIAIILAFCSSALHATGTFWGEWVDHFAMNLFAGFVLGINFWRCWPLPRPMIYALMACGVLLPSLVMLYYPTQGITLFVLVITVAGLLEVGAFRYGWMARQGSRRHLVCLCLWFVLAYVIWNLDYHKIICNPHNHILQGHSLWHLFNAFCFWHLFQYYKQFPKIGGHPTK